MANATLIKPITEMVEVEKVPGKVTLELTIEEAQTMKAIFGEMHFSWTIPGVYQALSDALPHNGYSNGHFQDLKGERVTTPKWIPTPRIDDSIWDD